MYLRHKPARVRTRAGNATWPSCKGLGFNGFYCRIWTLDSTHQQHSYCHHGRGAGGNGAVHEDDMIFADVFGQTQVMQLVRPREEETGYHGYRSRKGIVTTETHVMWRRETGFKKISCDSPPVLLNPRWSGSGSCRCGRPCTRPSGRAPSSRRRGGPTRR